MGKGGRTAEGWYEGQGGCAATHLSVSTFPGRRHGQGRQGRGYLPAFSLWALEGPLMPLSRHLRPPSSFMCLLVVDVAMREVGC